MFILDDYVIIIIIIITITIFIQQLFVQPRLVEETERCRPLQGGEGEAPPGTVAKMPPHFLTPPRLSCLNITPVHHLLLLITRINGGEDDNRQSTQLSPPSSPSSA